MLKRSLFVVSLALATVVLVAENAAASPLFSIGDGTNTSWQDAISAGNVVPVDPAGAVGPGSGVTWAAQQFYSDQHNGNYVHVPSQITAIDGLNVGGETFDSLVMSWDLPTSNDPLAVGAWDYEYDVDPDLTGTMIHFSLYPPPGVWDFSLELIDANGLSRGWFASNPANSWGNYWIDPNLAAAQGPFAAFFDQPGFDITQVIAIRLDEAGMSSQPFPVPPPGAPSSLPAWNAWNHLVVTPEPNSTVLLGLCTVGLIGCRRKNRE